LHFYLFVGAFMKQETRAQQGRLRISGGEGVAVVVITAARALAVEAAEAGFDVLPVLYLWEV
jgi:hypothetical protein